jgi:uncharacterized membrane protein SirB2
LRIKFLSDRADTCFSSLSLLQFLVKFILQIDNIYAGCRSWWYVLDPELSTVLILTGR